MFKFEVLFFGLVNCSLTMLLGPQDIRLRLELDKQGIYLAVFAHLESYLT